MFTARCELLEFLSCMWAQVRKVCREIEESIDRYTTGTYALALKYRYIEGLTYDQVGRRMDYSNTHVRRLLDEALDRYAKGWGEERE